MILQKLEARIPSLKISECFRMMAIMVLFHCLKLRYGIQVMAVLQTLIHGTAPVLILIGGNLGGNTKETCKRTSMMSKIYRIAFILLCFLIPAMQSCKQNAKKEISAERLMEIHKRDSVKLSLTPMLNNRDFEHVLPSIDSLIAEYPDDPQLYFMEGWVYDMQGDSLLARTAYTKSCSIYDSLIAANPNISDMVNRAYIVQILYGMDAYNRALDDMLSFVGSSRDSLWINDMRETVFKKEELSFCGLSNDTTLKNR